MELEKEESGISFWPRRFSDHNNNINTDDVVSNYKNNEKKKIKQNLELNLDPQNCFQVRKNIVDHSTHNDLSWKLFVLISLSRSLNLDFHCGHF